jgi:hypothetical protein
MFLFRGGATTDGAVPPTAGSSSRTDRPGTRWIRRGDRPARPKRRVARRLDLGSWSSRTPSRAGR